jgi:hypothetical protein
MPNTGLRVTMITMMLPYVRLRETGLKLSEAEMLEHTQRILELRERVEAEWKAGEPQRRAAIGTIDGIRDIEAAVECQCSCHQRTGELHDMGRSCPCQLTVEERQAALDNLWNWNAEEAEAYEKARAARDQIFMAAAERLGVEIESHGGAAPYVICGKVEGRAFFLRERHDLWRVEIATDQTPGENPWGDHEADSIVVAEGTSDVFDPENFETEALEAAVRAVREFLQRRACAHTNYGKWCSECGVLLEEAEKWRIWT